MTGETRWLRVRAVAGEWFAVLAAAFAVLALAGGYAAGTAYAAPGTETEQRTVEQWAVSGSFAHSATVTRENPVFPVGATLDDRPTYFVGATPVLDGTYTVSYSDAGGGGGGEPVDVAATATLVLRSTGEEDTVYWTDRERLAAADAALADGESATLSFSLNATAVDQRVADIRQGLGDTAGEVSATVEVAVNATGSVAGTARTVTASQSVPLTLGESTYAVGETEPAREAATTTHTVEVARSHGPARTVGGPLLLAVGLAGLGALAVLRRRGDLALTVAEREYLAFRDDRAEFDEWVVRARLPASVRDRERADAESLSDLVDYAIDADVGVVEDTATGSFYAVTRDVVVAFDPPAEPEPRSPFADSGNDDDDGQDDDDGSLESLLERTGGAAGDPDDADSDGDGGEREDRPVDGDAGDDAPTGEPDAGAAGEGAGDARAAERED